MLVTQIKLGVYHFNDHLPYIKEMSLYLQVAPETIRYAYSKLKDNHYISLSKNTGAKIIIEYSQDEIQNHIQEFFITRKDALIDLSQSMQPLFSHIQWLSLKNASEESLNELEQLITKREIFVSYRAIHIFLKLFSFLKNDILIRLIWWIYIFYQIPFFSVYKEISILEKNGYLLLEIVRLCRQQDWDKLKIAIDKSHEQIHTNLMQFYKSHIHYASSHEKIAFSWDVYKRNEQKQYSLGTEIIQDLSRGNYREGSFLPSLDSLAIQKNVSVSTVRRTLTLLRQIGAVKSINGVGTQILPINKIAENCDFSQNSTKKRLSDFVQSLYILTNSCQEIVQLTLVHMDESEINQLIILLEKLRNIHRCELAAYSVLHYVVKYAPYNAISIIYSQLFEQLLWGYPLRSIMKVLHNITIHIDTLIECLHIKDFNHCSHIVERLMINDLISASQYLEKIGLTTHIDIQTLQI